MSERFRLGLAGAGRMGRTHLRALSDSPDVAVVCVAEPIDSLRADAVDQFGVIGHASLESMLEGGGLDGVLIVTPSDTHVAAIATVASAGLPILCEKPCGVNADDTRRAAEFVRVAGVRLQVAYWRRFVPALTALRARIVAGDFGDLLSVSCLQWDGSPPASEFRARSGGIFVDMGVHEFDQARWLTGGGVATMSAAASSSRSAPGVDDPDAAQVLGLSDAGATVLVSLGRYYPGGDMVSVEVFGTGAHHYDLFLDPADGEQVQLDALAAQASAFAHYARGGDALGASVDDAICALEAAERAKALTGLA
ncbi:MAG: Gfo/Idh/MocA family protein [Acidimicrobiales bacterium]